MMCWLFYDSIHVWIHTPWQCYHAETGSHRTHDVASMLNKRHWRRFNVDMTSWACGWCTCMSDTNLTNFLFVFRIKVTAGGFSGKCLVIIPRYASETRSLCTLHVYTVPSLPVSDGFIWHRIPGFLDRLDTQEFFSIIKCTSTIYLLVCFATSTHLLYDRETM